MFGQKLPIFPKTVQTAALKIFKKVFGASLLIFVVAAAFACANPPVGLGTWTTASTGPDAGTFAKIIDLFVYAFGVAPFLFILLCLTRPAVFLIAGKTRPHAETTAMTSLVAAACLSAGLQFLLPNELLGGLFGMFAARDLGGLLGPLTDIVFGSVFLGIFFALALSVSGITFYGVLGFFYKVGRFIEWPLRRFFRRGSAPIKYRPARKKISKPKKGY